MDWSAGPIESTESETEAHSGVLGAGVVGIGGIKPRIAAVQQRIDRHDVTPRSMGEPNSMRGQFDFSGSPAIAAF